MRSASKRATSAGSPFQRIAGRYSKNSNPTTTTPSQIARFATGRPTSAAAAAAARIRDEKTKSARLADYPASAALNPEPMLALAYDYVEEDDYDDDESSLGTSSESAITSGGTRPPSAANNGNNASTIYPAPSAPQNTPASRKAAGGGGGGAGGRYVFVLYDPVGNMVIIRGMIRRSKEIIELFRKLYYVR
jgi:hypothetical protein